MTAKNVVKKMYLEEGKTEEEAERLAVIAVALAEADDEGGHWVTIRGTHVFIKDGEVKTTDEEERDLTIWKFVPGVGWTFVNKEAEERHNAEMKRRLTRVNYKRPLDPDELEDEVFRKYGMDI